MLRMVSSKVHSFLEGSALCMTCVCMRVCV